MFKKKEKPIKEKKIRTMKVGTHKKSVITLWVVLIASVSFGVYKNFTAIDQHTDVYKRQYYKRTVWFEMKRLCLSDYPKKQLEDFSRYVFGVPYAVIQEALQRKDVMKHGRNACAD